MVETKYINDLDVLVVGGGSAGASAAICAARQGLRVLIVEGQESLGGYACNGYVHGVAGNITGFCREWLEELEAWGGIVPRERFTQMPNVVFDPVKGKLLLETILLREGGRVLYGVNVVDCETVNGKIEKVIAYGKSGRLEITAKIYIDASGDAVLSNAAGVPCETGSPQAGGYCQGSTQVFGLTKVNRSKYLAENAAWMKDKKAHPDQHKHDSMIAELYQQGVENGDLPYFVFPVALFYPLAYSDDDCGDVTCNSMHSVMCRSVDVEDRTRQIIEQHKLLIYLEKFFQKYVPGFENCHINSIAQMHGFRDSRRILGEYIFKDLDFAAGAKFDDAICRAYNNFDNHHFTSRTIGFQRHIHVKEPVGSAVCRPAPAECNEMHPFFFPEKYEARRNPRDFAEIPYRSIIPRNVDNLLVAGRCVSAEFNASAAIRCIASCFSTGQAAAAAAKLSIEENKMPKEIDGRRVREMLIAQGCNLDELRPGFSEEERKGLTYRVTDKDTIAVVEG